MNSYSHMVKMVVSWNWFQNYVCKLLYDIIALSLEQGHQSLKPGIGEGKRNIFHKGSELAADLNLTLYRHEI